MSDNSCVDPRLAHKRLKNRQAAAKCREKKLLRIETLGEIILLILISQTSTMHVPKLTNDQSIFTFCQIHKRAGAHYYSSREASV